MSSLVVKVSMGFSIIQVESSSGVWSVLSRDIMSWVDFESDWIVDNFKEGLGVVIEVKSRKDRSSLDEGTLLLISNVDDLWEVRHWHDLLGVDVVPFLMWWEVYLNLGNSTEEWH